MYMLWTTCRLGNMLSIRCGSAIMKSTTASLAGVGDAVAVSVAFFAFVQGAVAAVAGVQDGGGQQCCDERGCGGRHLADGILPSGAPVLHTS
jgi:hypothetical protein